jgi:hypothetical protein
LGLTILLVSFGYALFFMTDGALFYLDNSDGWEIGVGPSIVALDVGAAKSMTTTTARATSTPLLLQPARPDGRTWPPGFANHQDQPGSLARISQVTWHLRSVCHCISVTLQ